MYENGQSDRSKVILNMGSVYSSSSLHDGNESFYEIYWDSLNLYERSMIRVLRDDAQWSKNGVMWNGCPDETINQDFFKTYNQYQEN